MVGCFFKEKLSLEFDFGCDKFVFIQRQASTVNAFAGVNSRLEIENQDGK